MFVFYVANFSAIGIVLSKLLAGTLTSIIFFLLWISFSLTIMLWGAELAAVLNEREEPECRLSQDRLTVRKLAERLDCPFGGDGETPVTGVGSLESAGRGDLVFLAHPEAPGRPRRERRLGRRHPGGRGLRPDPGHQGRGPAPRLRPGVELFYPPDRPAPGVHPLAFVAPSARIGPGASVGAFAWVGERARSGRSVIHPLAVGSGRRSARDRSSIPTSPSARGRIGRNVIIHDGAVIGADGFGYLKGADGRRIKIPQIGRVVIEDDVEIGANSAVDRAALDATVIRRGAKIDDLVMVAHNVEVGENAILIAQAGVAGSSKIGRDAILSGQVGVADHVVIGDGAIVAAKSGITKDVPAGAFVSGSPHVDIRDWRKVWAAAPRLYDLIKEFKRLRERVEELEKERDSGTAPAGRCPFVRIRRIALRSPGGCKGRQGENSRGGARPCPASGRSPS